MRRSRFEIILLALGLAACGETPVEDSPVLTDSSPAFTTEEVSIDGPSGRLGGIKTLPADPVTNAVTIIIPGSGPTDRDGNNPMGVNTNAYRLLAEGLAERGIASTRIDKRGMFSSEGAGDPNAVTLGAYAEDIAAWAEVMASDCVVLIGHSEGGAVALHAADTNAVCGVVLLTAAGRPIGDIIREQLAANPANLLIRGQIDDTISRLERGERVPADEMHTGLRPLFREEVQDFVISAMAFDAPATAQALDVPLMVVGGGADFQITRDDYDLLAPHADTTLWIERMSHVLKTADGTGRRASMTTYGDPELPLSEGLADGVAQFVVELEPGVEPED